MSSGSTSTATRRRRTRSIRREFRLAEGDAFNSFQVKRSQDRINSLGYLPGQVRDRAEAGLARPTASSSKPTSRRSRPASCSCRPAFRASSSFIVQASITQRNFRGKGQELRAGVNYSSYSKSVELGFTEPYLFDKNIAVGGDIFRRDYNAFNYIGNDRKHDLSRRSSTGFQVRAGVPLTEYWSLSGRYGLTYDEVGARPGAPIFTRRRQCDPLHGGPLSVRGDRQAR